MCFDGVRLSVHLGTSGPLRCVTAFQGLKSSYCSKRLREPGKKPAAPDALWEELITNTWPVQKVARRMSQFRKGPYALPSLCPISIPPPPASFPLLPLRFHPPFYLFPPHPSSSALRTNTLEKNRTRWVGEGDSTLVVAFQLGPVMADYLAMWEQ